MLDTLRDERDVNRPIASQGRQRPDPRVVIALIDLRILDLPATSLRRQLLEQMIERVQV